MIPPSMIIQAELILQGEFTDPTAKGAWPLFVVQEPDLTGVPNQCATLYDTTPVIDGIAMSTKELMQHYGLQLRARDPDYATGWNKLTDIINVLMELRQETVTVGANEYLVQSAVPTTGVIPLGVDDKRRSLFTLNFVVAVKEI